MSDNVYETGPKDSTVINLQEWSDIKFWCKKFACTEQQLKKAVIHEGSSPKAVEVFLYRFES